jgi:hypothetical protein
VATSQVLSALASGAAMPTASESPMTIISRGPEYGWACGLGAAEPPVVVPPEPPLPLPPPLPLRFGGGFGFGEATGISP